MIQTGDGAGGSDKAWLTPWAYRSDIKMMVDNHRGRVRRAQLITHIFTALSSRDCYHPIPQKDKSRHREVRRLDPQLNC